MKDETLLILGGLGLLYLINKNNGEQAAGAADLLQLHTHSDRTEVNSPSIDDHEDGGGIFTSGGGEGEPTSTILPAQTTYPVVFHPILTDPIEPLNTDQPTQTRRFPNGPVIYIEGDPEIQ